jgi:hypothetical protein
MKKTITLNDFRDAFVEMGREDNFSYEGLEVLFNYLEEVERSSDIEIELDVIAICCDYTECTIKEALDTYGLESYDELFENTMVLNVDDIEDSDSRIIYKNY